MHTHWSTRQSISQLRGFRPSAVKITLNWPSRAECGAFSELISELSLFFNPARAPLCWSLQTEGDLAALLSTGRKMANRGCGVLLGWASGALIERVAQNRRGKELLARRTLLYERGRFTSDRSITWILFFPPRGNAGSNPGATKTSRTWTV